MALFTTHTTTVGHTHTHTHTHAHMHTRTHPHTHTPSHTHTHIHTHTPSHTPFPEVLCDAFIHLLKHLKVLSVPKENEGLYGLKVD